nr:30S ribosomal protein S4 [Longispora sp. (in: high G+C Gram-positive bacteria)]
EKSREKTPFVVAAAGAHSSGAPYLDVNIGALRAVLLRAPLRVEVPVICDVQLVVEFYSR